MKTTEKHIGILGLGSRSTLFYLQQLNKQYHQKKGSYHTFPCTVYNVDFNTINPFLPNKFDALTPILKTHLDALFNLPIALCIIPNITLHETYDLANFNYPIAHPLNLAINKLKEERIQKVTVFGSKYSMESNYITSKLQNKNIEVNIPNPEDIQLIDSLRQKLYNNEESQNDIEVYKSLIESYSKQSTVLIACTELSILTEKTPLQHHVIDFALLQIEKSLNQLDSLIIN